VLVASLWLVAAIALIAAYIDHVAARNVELAIEARASLALDLERRSTEATLIYLLATNRANHRGLIIESQQRFAEVYPEELPAEGDAELWFDGTAYRGMAEEVFSLEDEAGLVSINTPMGTGFTALMQHVGLDPGRRAQFAARLEDYIDPDSRLRLNGAEKFDYERSHVDPPANWILITPLEAERILDFDSLLSADQWTRMKPFLTTQPSGGYNFNTMSPELMGALLDVDSSRLASLLAERRLRPVSSLGQLRRLTGVLPRGIEEDALLVIPSRFVRISLWRDGESSRQVKGVQLTPFGEIAPWQLDYQYVDRSKHAAVSAQRAETSLF